MRALSKNVLTCSIKRGGSTLLNKSIRNRGKLVVPAILLAAMIAGCAGQKETSNSADGGGKPDAKETSEPVTIKAAMGRDCRARKTGHPGRRRRPVPRIGPRQQRNLDFAAVGARRCRLQNRSRIHQPTTSGKKYLSSSKRCIPFPETARQADARRLMSSPKI